MGVTADSLAPILGLPLTVTYLVVDMRIFGFGERRAKPINHGRRKGQVGITGSHSLHLQCPWRLSKAGVTLTGSGDLYVYAGDKPSPDWHYEQGSSRQSVVCEALAACDAIVTSVRIDPVSGDFRIELDDGYVLEAFPCSTDDEHWRFFEVDSPDEHVVFESDE